MEQSGAFLTTCEAMMFQVCKDAKDPMFKGIMKLIKNPTPDTGLLDI